MEYNLQNILTESLRCTSEMNAIVQINYTSIKNKLDSKKFLTVLPTTFGFI